jgi:hypothetical protein
MKELSTDEILALIDLIDDRQADRGPSPVLESAKRELNRQFMLNIPY